MGFVNWWQNIPANLDPVIFYLGSFPIRWYGTMYLVAFGTVYIMMNFRLKRKELEYDADFIGDAITWAILGVILGGRLGYVLFYNLGDFLQEPWRILSPVARINGSWRFTGISGMSYHGGVIGIIIAWMIFARRKGTSFFKLTDAIVPAGALGYTFGRIGNFINGELYGRVTDSWIGMNWPGAGDNLLRHPSQLYEAFFEGVVLFAVLWYLRNRKLTPGVLTAIYIFGYGFFRFFIEYFREPDAHLGLIVLNLSTGQLLCLAMMIGSTAFWYFGRQEVRT